MLKIPRTAVLLLVMAILAVLPVQAGNNYDGLTLLGAGKPFQDESGASLTVYGFKTKYQESVVGFYFVKGTTQVRFYANAAAWDNLKQVYIKARDQWATLSADDFEMVGSVKSYRIANQTATMSISLQGATPLQGKQLLMSAMGGPSQINRIFLDMDQDDVARFVEQMYKADALLKGGGN